MPVSFISPRFQAIDDRGRPLVGGKLYVYANKTTIPSVTYQDAQGITLNTNPIILDARGEARVFLGETIVYTFVLKSAADVLIWSQDDITGNAGSSGGGTVPPATEEIAGIARLATEEEASVGTNHQTIMTPFRVRQVMTAWQLPRATTDQYGVTRFAKAMDDDPTLTAMNPALTTTFVFDEVKRLVGPSFNALNDKVNGLKGEVDDLSKKFEGGWFQFFAGTHTLSIPQGIKYIYVSGCGGGGGGGGSDANSKGAAGGRAGTCTIRDRLELPTTLGSEIMVSVGAKGDGGKGAAVGSGATYGKDGEETVITSASGKTLIILPGGAGSVSGEPGTSELGGRGEPSMFGAMSGKYGKGGDGGGPSTDTRFGNDGKSGGNGYLLVEW